MGLVAAVRHNVRHYADFRGRAPRSQYWWWVLFVGVSVLLLDQADSWLGSRIEATSVDLASGVPAPPLVSQGLGILVLVFIAVTVVPSVAVSIRRLHDTDDSGWWVLWGGLLGLLCCIGFVILTVKHCQRGTLGPNRYGPDPLAYA